MNICSLDISDKQLFDKYYSINKYKNSEASFASLFLWKKYYNTRYILNGGFLTVIAENSPGEPFFNLPLGEGDLAGQIEEISRFMMLKFGSWYMGYLTEQTKALVERIMPGRFEFKEHRNAFDYIYNTADLINLSGKKLHSKKNHLNAFLKSYDYEYHKMTGNEEECRQFVLSRIAENNPDPSEEIEAMKVLFDNFTALGLTGAYLKADGRVIAVTAGENLHGSALVHLEKADTSYRGAYAAINQMFIANEFPDAEFVNREEDMGSEGLRKAKMSYNPCAFIKKYIAYPLV